MKVAIVGSGYVGLVSGACFAELGHTVYCIDNDAGKIAYLQNGNIPIFEPGLDNLVAKNIRAGRLTFSSNLAEAVEQAEVVIIAVGTPPNEDGSADLQYVVSAAKEIATHIKKYTLIVTKSTVPVGTGAMLAEVIAANLDEKLFDIASNPEFLREGAAINDFMKPDRIVVGAQNQTAINVLEKLYAPLIDQGVKFIAKNINTSELIKYTANAFLATKISFINEISDLCERVGAEVSGVAEGIGLDDRIGSKFLNPGPGYGGSCFPKDTRALLQIADKVGLPLQIVAAAEKANDDRKGNMAKRVVLACGDNIAGKTIAILGLAFKANTDDVRESVALTVIPLLEDAGAIIKAYDPEAMENTANILSKVNYCDSISQVIEGADALVILTEWPEFKKMPLAELYENQQGPIIIDLRRLLIDRASEIPDGCYVTIGIGSDN